MRQFYVFDTGKIDKKITKTWGQIIENTQLPKIVTPIIKMISFGQRDSMVGFKYQKTEGYEILRKGESYGECCT